MSHEITNIDRQEGIEQAWHGLTQVKAVITLRDCWLALWDIVKSPLFAKDEAGKDIVSDYCQLVASDNRGITIGAPVHTETFSPITNARFLAIVSEAINLIPGAIVASVGSVCARCRVFVSVKLPQVPAFQAAGREFKPYLNFLNSHDQSAPFVAVVSFVCTVCNNTFGMNLSLTDGDRTGINAAMGRKELRIRLKHTKHVADRLENVPAVIDAFLGVTAMFQAGMEYLGATAIDPRDVDPLFAGFLTDLGAGMISVLLSGNALTKEQIAAVQMSGRRKNQIASLTRLHHEGKGNKGLTLADAFSAVTDYYSHESAGGLENPARQLVSSEYGAGQEAKAQAFKTLLDAEATAKAIAVGKAILAAQVEA